MYTDTFSAFAFKVLAAVKGMPDSNRTKYLQEKTGTVQRISSEQEHSGPGEHCDSIRVPDLETTGWVRRAFRFDRVDQVNVLIRLGSRILRLLGGHREHLESWIIGSS